MAVVLSSFFKIVGPINCTGFKHISCVQYLLLTLVNENIINLTELVDREVNDVADRKALSKYLASGKEFLKYPYFTHLEMKSEED